MERGAADLDAIIKAKQEEISGLETTAKQEEQAAVDASKGLDGLGASCGPNCLSHRAKAMEAQKRIATIRETLQGPIAERANALRRRDALDAEAISLKLKADSGAEAQARPLPKGETAAHLGAMLHQLAALRDECAPTRAGVSCARPSPGARRSYSPRAAQRRSFDGRGRFRLRASWRASPRPFDRARRNDRRARRVRQEMFAGRRIARRNRRGRESYSRGVRHGPDRGGERVQRGQETCRRLRRRGKAGRVNETDLRALLKRSDDFLRAHTTERNKFELAREAFWSFTPDATMAICVAMAQDGFVLIMKFLSEIFKRGLETRERRQFVAPQDLTDSEADPVEARAMKAVMRAAKPVHGDMSEIDPEAATLALLPLNVRENLTALLNRLVRDEIAHVDRKGYYLVDNITISQIEQRLAAAMRMRWGRGPRFGGADAGADGPKSYYGDPTGEPARRRRPSALERYLTHLPEPEEVAAAPGERAR